MQSTLLCSLTLFLVFNALLSEATFRCFSCNDTGGAGACSAGTNYTYTSEDDKPCYIQIEGSNFRRGVCASDCAAELAVPNAVTYTCNYSECNHVYGNPQSTDPTCLWCPFSGCAGNTQRENGIICYMALSKDGITIYRGACNNALCSDKRDTFVYDKFGFCIGVNCNSAANNNDGAFDKIVCNKWSGGILPLPDGRDWWDQSSSTMKDGLGCIAMWWISWSDHFYKWDSCVTPTCTEEKKSFLSNNSACTDEIASYSAYAYVCTANMCNYNFSQVDFTTVQTCTPTAATGISKAPTITTVATNPTMGATDLTTMGTTTTKAHGSSDHTAVSRTLNTLMGMCIIAFGVLH